MKTVAYLRVSTEDQSLERQYEDIEKFATRKNLQLVKIFEDKVSGSKTNADDREGFSKLERYLELNEDIKHILVLEISRLGRKNNDIQNIVERYNEKGICIHFDDLSISTLDKDGKRSATSDIMISVMGAMAAGESRLLSARVKSGKMSRARKNQAFGSKIIGYKKADDGTPMIDEDEAPIIRRIFELSADGLGMRGISAIIESEFNRRMHMSTLGGIIRNTFHKGERKYNDLILPVEPIVSMEIWQKANDSMDSRNKFGSRTKVNTNIVEGRIKCHCGEPMYQKVVPSGRMDSFVCKDLSCKNSVNRPWLFRMVKKVVERHAKKSRDAKYRKDIGLKMSSHQAQINLNNREEEKLNARKWKFQDAWGDGDLSDDDYKYQLQVIKQNLLKINVDNIQLNEDINLLGNDLNSEIKHFSDDLELFKNEIKDIVKYVEIDKDSVIINVFGRWGYDLFKPNSVKLGWEARKPESERYLNEKLPLRHPIEDEVIEIMADTYGDENYDDKLDDYMNELDN
ncbi:recombinase family protein [Arenibacter troitsensis]|uniref:Site-specific DNA recombinase n=1 Tax=Arenibacter troitsensis TaxID=188872 RepID=A0A1X7J9G6_9FLAO|nr:recombinase family protein [Arenibacter troitsensis]SMG23627.1 Site-specific DNA recombinase [Arenibacter troitsensis]